MTAGLTKNFREVEYFFLRMFLYSLFRPDEAYRRIRAFTAKKSIYGWRKEKVQRNLEIVFGGRFNQKERENLSEQYLEILSCDDIDCYIWFLHAWSHIRKNIKIENKEIIEKIGQDRRGCVVLSAHFGGGFFVFEMLRDLQCKPQVIGRPIRYEYFKPDVIRWLYYRFRAWCLRKTIGEEIIYTERKDTRERILKKINEGYQIYITFDVPPHFTKGPIEKVFFLNRYWKFPTGFLELLSHASIPIVPLFTYLTGEGTRVFKFFPEYQTGEGGSKEALQKCANLFEKYILERPEQWFFWDDAQVFW